VSNNKLTHITDDASVIARCLFECLIVNVGTHRQTLRIHACHTAYICILQVNPTQILIVGLFPVLKTYFGLQLCDRIDVDDLQGAPIKNNLLEKLRQWQYGFEPNFQILYASIHTTQMCKFH